MSNNLNSEQLKNQTIKGVAWRVFERVSTQLVSLVVSTIIARELDPSDYAIVGVVNIFITFADLLIAAGFNDALIQKKDADIYDYSSIFFVNLFLSFVLYGIFFAFAPLISRLYKISEYVNVMRIMGVMIVLDAILVVIGAYISNKLAFDKSFNASIITMIVSGIIGVYMALNNYGIWSLVVQTLVATVIKIILLVIMVDFKIHLVIRFDRVKSLLGYGSKMFLANVIGLIYEETNPMIIGIKYSSDDLAFYSKGKNFPELLNTTMNSTISSVLFPIMSKIQDDKEALLEYTRKFIKTSSFIIFPVMTGLLAVSDGFIKVLLTEKWIEAASYMKIFCLSYMLNIVTTGNLQAIKAIGRSDIILKLEVIKKTSYFIVITLFVVLTNKPQAFAFCHLICTIIGVIVNTYPNQKLINYSYRKQIKDILPNLLSAIIMSAIVILCKNIVSSETISLLLQVFIGIISYVVINAIIKNENLIYLYNMIKGLLKKE